MIYDIYDLAAEGRKKLQKVFTIFAVNNGAIRRKSRGEYAPSARRCVSVISVLKSR